jgi:hypothetical protein
MDDGGSRQTKNLYLSQTAGDGLSIYKKHKKINQLFVLLLISIGIAKCLVLQE